MPKLKKVAKRKSHDGGQIDRYSTGRPKIKRACAKEAPRRSPPYNKGQELKKLKSHDGGQIDRHSTGRPEIKVGMRKEAPGRSPPYSKGQEPKN